VIDCDNEELWREISFGDMFISHLSSPGDIWVNIKVDAGENVPTFDDLCKESFDGIVVTGSRCNCRDGADIPWFGGLCELIRQVNQSDKLKLIGGCFGAQIIAFALNGSVDHNPTNKLVMKAESIYLSQDKQATSLIGSLLSDCDPNNNVLTCLEVHGDCVTALPPNSILLASSESCAHEIFLVPTNNNKDSEISSISGDVNSSNNCHHYNILAIQCHPEFDVQYCIFDRIWDIGKTYIGSDEQQQQSYDTLVKYNRKLGADRLIQMMKHFLNNSSTIEQH